jgi:CHAD domain-containing protein
VHQARVATRRLRSDLRTFRSVVLADRVEPLRDELRWLGQLLGAVRDNDVLRRRLAAEVDELDDEDREAGRKLLAVLDGQRASHLAALHEALDSHRYLALLDALVELATDPPLLPEAGEPARSTLPRLAVKPWEHLTRNIAGLPKRPSNEELHRVRILAKRARYAAEAASPVVPPAGRYAAALADLQGVLGDHQDAVVGEAWLRSVVRDGCDGGEAFAAGLLVSKERSVARRHRDRWRDVWDAANRKKLRGWLEA